MEAHNIISTPEITGNIGSCTTQVVQAISGRDLFKEYVTTISTNSCTGEVEKYQSWEFSGFLFFVGFCFIFILTITFIALMEKVTK